MAGHIRNIVVIILVVVHKKIVIKMTSTHDIKYNTTNTKISDVLNEDKIRIITLDNNKIFEYNNDNRKNKIIVVHFKYNNKIVSQAFYQCQTEFKGTWLPFDGIKANKDKDNVFYQYIDNEPFKNDLYPFGDEKLMCVSYLLGGGIWCNRNMKYRNLLNVDERISYLTDFKPVKVDFNNSLYINHFINYSISRNYYDKHPNTKFRPKSPKWISSHNNIKNEQRLFSAFDFSYKMNNSYQIEYTPPIFEDKVKREDYNEFYLNIDNCIVKENTSSYQICSIL